VTRLNEITSPAKKVSPANTAEAQRQRYLEKRCAEVMATLELKRGQPTKYKPEYVEMVKFLSPRGLTDWEFAELFGVSTKTLNTWCARYPEFNAAFEFRAEA